jgi:tetratricopeptide (TPR) repeat protein
MQRLLGALLAVTLLLPACNLQSAARVDSIRRLNEGIGQMKKNNVAGAEKALKEAIQLDPAHAVAHATLGKLYRKNGKWADAEKAFKDAMASMGEQPDAEYAYELGLVQVAQADEKGMSTQQKEAKYREAIASFQEAIKVNPQQYKAHYRAGTLFEKLDEPVQADQAYRKAIEINAKYSPAFVALGNMYIDYGHSNIAMVVLDAGAKINESDAQMWNGLGRAYTALNKPKEAVDAFKKATALDPEAPDSLYGLGMAYAELRQKKEAQETLEKFLQRAGGGNVPQDTVKAAQDTLQRMQDVL